MIALDKIVIAVRAQRGTDGVKLLHTIRFFDEVMPAVYGDDDPYSEEGVTKFKAFCKEHSIFYYARPRESYRNQEAYDLAFEAKAKYLVREDLS